MIKVDLGWPLGSAARERLTPALLRKRMEEAIDGEYQAYKVRGGAYTREHFFGKVSRAGRDGRDDGRMRISGDSIAAGTIRTRSTRPMRRSGCA